jgi:hypothetical protein
MRKRPLKIGLPDGQVLTETLPDHKREFELRCGRGLARYLSAEYRIEIRTELVEDDEQRGDVRLVGPNCQVEVQIVEPAINTMHQWASQAVEAQRTLDGYDTAALAGLFVHFEDPQPPRMIRRHLATYLCEAEQRRPTSGRVVLLMPDGPLGKVRCRATNDPDGEFKAWFWPRSIASPGISSAIARKIGEPYPNGTCLLIATTLDIVPDGQVAKPDFGAGSVECVDDLELACRCLASQDHPFMVVWRSILMPWSYEDGDSICVLYGRDVSLFP